LYGLLTIAHVATDAGNLAMMAWISINFIHFSLNALQKLDNFIFA